MNPENGERRDYGTAAGGLGPLFSGLIAASLIALTLLVAVALGMGEQKMLAQVEPTMTATATPRVVPSSPTPVPGFTEAPSSTPTVTSSATTILASPATATPTTRLTRTPRPTIVRATPTTCVENPWGWTDKWWVVRGDNLFRMAADTGTTVEKLQIANCLGTSTTIITGQAYWVPRPRSTSTSTPTQTPRPTVPPPVIDTFVLEPNDQVIVGECVEIDWVVEGDVDSISLLARTDSASTETLVTDAPKTGSHSDCPTAAGTRQYTLEAVGPDGSSKETRTITVVEPPPVAAFTADPTSGTAPLTVAFTDESGGDIATWAWDFGDKTTSGLQHPSHEYATAGDYTVILTVTGPGGSDSASTIVHVDAPPEAPVAGFTAEPTSGIAPLTVAFTDESGGDIATWAWDFGDKTTSGLQHPSHEYATAGDYTVILTVTGPGGSDSASTTVHVDAPPEAPVAGFTAEPTSGIAPLTVVFTDESTGDITAWEWAFGDKATSDLQHPSHEYTIAGDHTVILTVTGPGGSDSASTTVHVGAPPEAPVAGFTAEPTSGIIPLTVVFTDESTGDITTWAWDFGDETTSDLQHPSHEYSTAGDYTVILTVTGPGGSDEASATIHVDPLTDGVESGGLLFHAIAVTPCPIALMAVLDQPLPT